MHGDVSQREVEVTEIVLLSDVIEDLNEKYSYEAGLIEYELKKDRLLLLGKLAACHLNVVQGTD